MQKSKHDSSSTMMLEPKLGSEAKFALSILRAKEKVLSFGRCEDCGNFSEFLELDVDGLYKCEICAVRQEKT